MIIKIYLHQEKQYIYKVHVHVQVITKKNSGKASQSLIFTEIIPKKTIKLCTLYRDKHKEVFKRNHIQEDILNLYIIY